MSLEGLIIWLVIGAIAGWLASLIMKRSGPAITGNHLVDMIITGVIGAFFGGWLLGVIGISLGGGMIGSIISAVIGAVIFIFLLGLLRR